MCFQLLLLTITLVSKMADMGNVVSFLANELANEDEERSQIELIFLLMNRPGSQLTHLPALMSVTLFR